MNRVSCSIFVACALAMLLAAQCVPPRNPPLNSAIAAHGNTDWHIDTANEFLFGVDMGGNPTAANHCGSTWSRRHIHVGLTNTAHFYCDSDKVAGGADTDATSGIETAMLFFYAGHGDPTSWDTLGDSATQGDMELADYADGGLLRYYWQCSCKVFAHGPLNCPGSTHAYACPGDFDGSADSSTMRNVYQRWGPALTADLRMACGVSTLAYCHETEANRIWDNYNNNALDVADSFIDGLHRFSWVTPLCITLGGSDVTKTPLYDATFTNLPNTSGTSYYHIQYLQNFASTRRWPILVPRIPELLPILEIGPLPLPDPLREIKFLIEDDLMLSPDEVGERGPRVRVNRLSGAVYLVGERKPSIEDPVLEEREYIQRASRFMEEQGWTEKTFAEPIGERLMIATMPVKGEPEQMEQLQKNVIVFFKRQIDVEGTLVNVLGEGGLMGVQMNNDGSVLNGWKVWREIVGVKRAAPVKSFDEAHKEALELIMDADAYELDRWEWGYKEMAGNVEQNEMRIVFRFWFVPADPEAVLKYPPQMIEILGQPE